MTHNTERRSEGAHSVFLDALSEFVRESWPEFLCPGACQEGKGMDLKDLLTS